MEALALKLVLTPALIGAVSLAGRRWGPGVSLAGFFLVLALSIEGAGIPRAFAAAIAAALVLQGGALWALRRESPA